MCTRFCYKNWGITVAFRERGKEVQEGEKNITSIHILTPLFYKDSPRLDIPPTRTIPTMIKEMILGVKNSK